MDFELDEDQVELQRLVRDVLERECPPSLVRAVVENHETGGALWQTLVDLGWPGLAVPAALGGAGLSTVELVITLEELGRVADPTPFLATTTQYTPLVRASADDAQVAASLGAVCAGRTGAVAWSADTVRATATPGGGWGLRGTARGVLDGDRADEIAVVASMPSGRGVFVVAATDVAATRTPAVDASLHLADVTFDGAVVPADRSFLDAADAIDRAMEEALTGIAACTVGASQRILELALAHIRSRNQFGVPIGSFQAVKHMAVDMYVAIERARALCHFAALTIAADDPRRGMAAAMAKVAAGDGQRIACRHGIQMFGALGYTWENDLQLYVRRAKAGELLLGIKRPAPGARRPFGAGRRGPMKLQFDDDVEAFRRGLSSWLDAHMPDASETTVRSHSSADIPEWARRWQRKLFDAGWLVPGNPPEYGGRNATLLEQFVHMEELGRRHIYLTYNPQGLAIIVPSILAFGTDEQKQRWAVPILRAEMTAALGMSEPGAGSDLAGLRTRATLDGDHFVVNGQKVWTSGAHDADVIFTFVRTDPDAPKHKGISALLIPTTTKGVTRRPFASIIGPDDIDFNEVFFDDVVVPADNLIGQIHDGWHVATGSLGHERAMLWLSYAERLDYLISNSAAALPPEDALALDGFGRLVIDTYALRLLGYRALAKARRGVEAAEQSILKLLGSEALQAGTEHVLETLGSAALDPSQRTASTEPLYLEVFTGGWFELYLRTFSGTIAGGTSQIQRNIIAERVLGLPR